MSVCVYCLSLCVPTLHPQWVPKTTYFVCTKLIKLEWYTTTHCSQLGSDVILHHDMAEALLFVLHIKCVCQIIGEYSNRIVSHFMFVTKQFQVSCTSYSMIVQCAK